MSAKVNTHAKDVPDLAKRAGFAQGTACQPATLAPLGYYEPLRSNSVSFLPHYLTAY